MTVKVKKWLLTMSVAATTLFCGSAVACGNLNSGEDPKAPILPSLDESDLGTYYCDADGQEYTITLLDDYQLAFMVKEANGIGSYTVSEDGALTFTFTGEDMGEIAATLQDNVLTFTYDGTQMRFLKKVYYTVYFEENGAAALKDGSVLNGKTLAEPENYERDGFVLIGWYKDAAFQTPFGFGTDLISSDLTLYAYWAPKAEGQDEFNVTFDYNYDGATSETVETIGGKLYTLPTPTRDGYVFAGWWISMYDDAEKLSFAYDKDYAFTEHTTLYARWEQADALIVNVDGNTISWNSVGTGTYQLTITGPEGFNAVSETIPTTSKTLDFAAAPAGDYVITVAQGDKSSTIYYKNKALAKVSLFEVVDSTLVFNEVPNAEKYLIYIDCGSHTHAEAIDNGKSTTYNFSSCDMQEGGIIFTVEAHANGYVSSASYAYIYNRILDKVENIRLDNDTQELSWDVVPYATNYILQIKAAGQETVEIDTGSKTSYSLKDYDAGEIVVNVYPKAKGYNSPAATSATFDKQGLATPHDLKVSDMTLTWSEIKGANKYTVQFGNKSFDATTASLTLTADMIALVEESDYEIRIKAIGATGESLWSDIFDVRYYAMYDTIEYGRNTVTWRSVLGADGYEVMVNDGEIISCDASATSARIALTARSNKIAVRFTDGNYRSDWVETTVAAYKLTFDTIMGEPIADQYVALGDEYTLPEASKRGYSFEAWYSAPGGAAGNATKYESGILDKEGDFVLYAFWNANTYDITYKYEYEGCTDGQDSMLFGSLGKLETPLNTDSRFVFGGWYTEAGGHGDKIADENGQLLANWNYAETATLYAHWYRAFDFTLAANGTYVVKRGLEANISVKDLTIPATYEGVAVTVVDGYAFRQCTNIRSISIPDTIQTVEGTAFFGCSSLESISVYETEGNHDRLFFSYDGALFQRDKDTREVSLWMYPIAKKGAYAFPEGVQYIASNAFSNSLITEVTLPSTLLEIPVYAFVSCRNLTAINFTESDAANVNLTIAEDAFVNLPKLTNFFLPKQYTSFNRNIFDGCDALVSFEVSEGHTAYTTADGVLCDADSKIVCFPMGRTDESYTIPSTITGICENAFQGSAQLKTIVITENVASIGANAFAGCTALETVTFESAIAPLTIGANAFQNLTNLKSLVFKADSNVISIGENAFNGCNQLTNLELPASLESIGANAFANCQGLVNVKFPNSDKALSLSQNAFYNCTQLTKITLSSNVEAIDMGAFGGCTALSEVLVDQANEHFTSVEGVVYTIDQTTLVYYPVGKTETEYSVLSATTAIAARAFEGNLYLQQITLPEALESIGDSAFKDTKLASVSMKDTNVKTIGNQAFYNNTNLKTVDLSDALTTIGEQAFYNGGLTSISFPAGLESIGNEAFANTAIESVTLTAGVQYGTGVFSGTGSLTSATIAEGVTEIPNNTFFTASRLQSVTIPNTVTSIGDYAFYATGLTSLSFTNGGTALTIGADAFERVSSLQSLILPDHVTEIGNNAFSSCSGLSEVEFKTADGKTSLKSIGDNAFAYCSNLTSFTIPETTGNLTLGDYLFDNGDDMYSVDNLTGKIATLNLPSTLFSVADHTFANMYSLETITVTAAEGAKFKSVSGILYGDFGADLLLCPAKTAGDITIPNTVTFIADSAFYLCQAITSVTFEEGGTKLAIGTEAGTANTGAFANCWKLAGISLPEHLTYIGSYAFAYTGLQSLSIPSSVQTIDKFAFISNMYSKASELETLTFATREENGVQVSDLKTIGQSAFQSANLLKTLLIPASVETIDMNAFRDLSALEKLTFAEGSQLKTIGDSAFQNNSIIKELILPASVEIIGNAAFSNWSALETLVLPSSLTDWNYAYDSNMPFYIYSNSKLTNITMAEGGTGKYYMEDGVLFNNGENGKKELVWYPSSKMSENYSIPAGTTNIARSAFSKNTYLTSVWIPNTVTFIGAEAFRRCTSLSAVTFEKGGTEALVIDGYNYTGYAFGETALREIEIPARTISIGVYAFANNPSTSTYSSYYTHLTKVTFEENCILETIGNYAFQSNDLLTEIELPNSVVSIGESAFQNCSGLTKVTLPESLEQISTYAFQNCRGLAKIDIPASVETIGRYAFSGQYESQSMSLAEINFLTDENGNSALTTIADYAFGYNNALKTLEGMPESLTSIGQAAFQYCTALESVTLPDSLKQLGDEYGNGRVFQYCRALKTVDLSESLELIAGDCFSGCAQLEGIVIPNTVKTIGNYAFQNCSKLESLTLEEGGENGLTIENYVFSGTAIQSVTLPSRLESFGLGVFNNCSSLLSAVFEQSDYEYQIGDQTFGYCRNLKSVKLSDGITKIGHYAFADCSSLEEILLPATVMEIGSNAFQNCSTLTEFLLPGSVTSIGSSAFLGCNNLASFQADTSNAFYTSVDGLLFNSEETELIAYPFGNTEDFQLPESVTTIAAGVFSGGKFTTFTVPAGVTELSDRFFQNCANLTTVTLHDNITSIGANAFDGCRSLTTIENMPSNLKTIGQYAFQYCALTSIELPEGIESIGSYAFNGCSSLASVNFPEGLKSIGEYAFQNAAFTSLELPSTLESLGIGKYAFAGNSSLQTVAFKKPAADATNVFAIGGGAFQYCSALTSVMIPSNVRAVSATDSWGYVDEYFALGYSCFQYCSNLRQLTIDTTNADNFEGNFNIDSGAFQNCTSLESLTLPYYTADKVVIQWGSASVKPALNSSAFQGCSSLKSVTFDKNNLPDTTVTISDSAFQDCTLLESVTLPNNLAAGAYSWGWLSNLGIGSRAFFGCTSLKEIEIPEGIIGIADYAFANSGITSVSIPSTVVEIKDSAYLNCASLGAVTLSEGIQKIGYNAFSGSALTSINIPTTVTEISLGAFNNCASLESVTFDEIDGKMAELTYGLESGLFENCAKLSTINLPNTLTSINSSLFRNCTSLTEITIPKTVTSIGSEAFYGSGLETISIPASVTSIGSSAFENSALTSVTFAEGLETINSAAFKNLGLEIVNLPSTIKTLSTNVFQNCAKLSSVNFAPDTLGLTAIEANTFSGCTSLTAIELPASVERLGDAAFGGCSSLAAFEIPASLKTLGSNPFEGCASLTITVSADNEYYWAQDNMLFNAEKTELLGVFGDPTSAVIPDTVETIVANAFAGKTSLESVTLPANLKRLNAYVFKGCIALTSVELPDGIEVADYAFAESGFTSLDLSKATSIGNYAFYNSTALTSVTLPDSLSMIRDYMFAGCTALTSFEIPAAVTSIGERAFAESGVQTIAIPATVTNIGRYAFYKCAELTTFTFDKDDEGATANILVIAEHTFDGCAKLTQFDTPQSVRTIGVYAFAESGLQSITLPKELTSLGASSYYYDSYVFYNCKDLTTVSTLGKITTLAGYTFAGCSSLSSIELPDSLTALGNNVFEGTGIVDITLPSGITSFSSNIFKDCKSLNKVVFAEGITSMGYSALFGGTSLKEVVIASTITQIPYSAFENLKSLETVTFAEGSQLTMISGNAFSGCSSLKSINLPEGLTSIWDSAFSGCTALTSITVPSTVTTMNGNVFNGWTAEQTINLNFAEGSLPTSWSSTWNNNCLAQIIYLG